jgi:hypothetical protein
MMPMERIVFPEPPRSADMAILGIVMKKIQDNKLAGPAV